MKKSLSKLIVFGAIVFTSSLTSCKTGGGYGCDYTEASVPKEIENQDLVIKPVEKQHFKVVRNVSE